jgi:hypothetical protein
MAKPLTRAETELLALELQKLIAKIEAGDLKAMVAMRYRIEGAITALRVALGELSQSEFGLGIARVVPPNADDSHS